MVKSAKKRICLGLMGLLVVGGCSSTYIVQRSVLDKATSIKRSGVKDVALPATDIDGYRVNIALDSLGSGRAKNAEELLISAYNPRATGFVVGGAIIGVGVLVAIIAKASYQRPDHFPPDEYDKADKDMGSLHNLVFMGGLGVGLLGGLLSLAVGLFLDSPERDQVHPAELKALGYKTPGRPLTVQATFRF